MQLICHPDLRRRFFTLDPVADQVRIRMFPSFIVFVYRITEVRPTPYHYWFRIIGELIPQTKFFWG